jgi:acyl-CoA synthetase (AMP-forming)/AMP-acid ligase II
VDEDGHLFVDDRIDDVIVTGGENVYPKAIEDAIYRLDGVSEVAVVGTPHERLGELVTAIVRGDGVTRDDVESVCRDHLSDFKIPRRVHFVDSLPRTATRKVDKVALREQFGSETDAGDVSVV